MIVTPALADANNGNWQTARRWQRMLSSACATRITGHWPDALAEHDTVMLSLHARRSAESVAAWAAKRPAGALAVVLTGTDLYRDIQTDASAQRSLALADRLVCLQALAPRALPPDLRAKAVVVVQSTRSRPTVQKTGHHLRALMVGHLRAEKDPLLLMAAARMLKDRTDLRIDHVGAALDPALGDAAAATAHDCPHYRWLGQLSHEATRRRIQRAHVLVHASRMEGGAHVVMEAVCSGTPVLASSIDGNVGLLGNDYAGYFPPGDAQALARLLCEARQTQGQQGQPGGLLARLAAQCEARSHLFSPEAERAGLLNLLRLLESP